jgi:hypothetical protein
MISRTLLLLLAFPAIAAAQDPRPTRSVPRDAAREAASIYNSAEIRQRGRYELREGETVSGTVGVLEGPAVIGGRVQGSVVALNADVVLLPSARIDGDLLVLGGSVDGRATANVGGEIRIYRQRVDLRVSNVGVEVEESSLDDDSWWRRMERRRAARRNRIIVASMGGYNRVEGLPVGVGPNHRQRIGGMNFDGRALAVLRTGSSFRSDDADVGYLVSAELRSTHRTGYAVTARAYELVDAVEDWQLSDLEAGVATFLFRRDYRDYYGRHGASIGAELFQRGSGSVSLTYSHERWLPRDVVNPWTLWRTSPAWRPHPELDEGVMNLVAANGRLDTRNNPEGPTSGWLISLDLEWGGGTLTDIGGPPGSWRNIGGIARNDGGRMSYTRGFLDARRYNRISPDAQLNFRVVAGGWLGGDELPLQRRLSVGGVGSVPGLDFRSGSAGLDDASACNGGIPTAGRPAMCERIALGQVEYRGTLDFGLFDRWEIERSDGTRGVGWWVMFLNAGRGWRVRHPTGVPAEALTPRPEGMFGRGTIPPLSSFLSDIGVGIDFGDFGAYVAKSLSHGSEPLNFFMRLRHRF